MPADYSSKPVDSINPKHYRTHPSGVECIEITRHMNFNLGNAIKYIWRAEGKGNAIEDLQKAEWYIRDEIERLRSAAPESGLDSRTPRPDIVPAERGVKSIGDIPLDGRN